MQLIKVFVDATSLPHVQYSDCSSLFESEGGSNAHCANKIWFIFILQHDMTRYFNLNMAARTVQIVYFRLVLFLYIKTNVPKYYHAS